jgi:hypothetical protein
MPQCSYLITTVSSGTWILHHSNVPCPLALAAREFLAKHSNPVFSHLTYQLWSPATSPLPQAQCHPEGEKILRAQRYNWIWQSGCKAFWNRPTTHGRVSSITA